jgi:uncharacterized protein
MNAARQPVPFASLALAPFLALNNAHAFELSLATEARFQTLVSAACYAKGFTEPAGFLLAFDETAEIDSVNYRWFKDRFQRFVYIDRVVIDASARRQGLARALYADLIAWAGRTVHTRIGCEINNDPPNVASDAFHAQFGFRAIGSAQLVESHKTVRYMMLDLAPSSGDQHT